MLGGEQEAGRGGQRKPEKERGEGRGEKGEGRRERGEEGSASNS